METETGASAAQYKTFKVDFDGANAINYDVDGAGNEIQSDENLWMRLRRIAKTGGKTECAGEIVITHVGLICVRDKLGVSA